MKVIIANENASADGMNEFFDAPEAGTISSVSLKHSTDFWTALRHCFRCNGNEEISGIVIKDGFLYAKIHKLPPKPPEVVDLSDLSRCPNCDERAWDGRICHLCGAKNI